MYLPCASFLRAILQITILTSDIRKVTFRTSDTWAEIQTEKFPRIGEAYGALEMCIFIEVIYSLIDLSITSSYLQHSV
jgi:hypothetical protein